jgi:hypothetical protein
MKFMQVDSQVIAGCAHQIELAKGKLDAMTYKGLKVSPCSAAERAVRSAKPTTPQMDAAIEKYHAEPDPGTFDRKHGRYYVHKNAIKKAGAPPKHALQAKWWVGCEVDNTYTPPTEEQMRSWSW